jgi:glutamyl-Q tRNA(Asp) synthetase
MLNWRFAKARGGIFLLRIEDIDVTRARPEFEAAIMRRSRLAWH